MNTTNEKGRSRIWTKILEMIFNADGHYLTKPLAHERSTKILSPEQPTIKPLTMATTEGQNQNLLQKKLRAYPEPNNEKTTARPTTRPLREATTLSPYQKSSPKWFNKELANKPNYERTTIRPLWNGAVEYERTTIRHVEQPLIIQSGSSFGLENCLLVVLGVLGGVGMLILLTIFMKIGQPIRIVRRQLSNNRSAPDAITVSLHPYYGNFDMGFLLRSGETAASTDPAPMYDSPPPYIECMGSCSSINKYDSEEPPPRYSATLENFKDTEPQLQINTNTER